MRYRLLIPLFTVILAGCGFEPLHSRSYHDELALDLASVAIETNNTRLGQLLKAEIEGQVNPVFMHAEKLFKLSISFSELEVPLFINPDGTSSRGDLQFQSTYRITRVLDGKLVDSGNIQRVSSYNTSENADYASYVSEEDARKRGILELAQDYKLRLANLLPKLNNPNATVNTPSAAALPPIPTYNPLDHHEMRRSRY